MNWQDYEATVKTIYETLGRAKDVFVECYGASCKRKGASGVEHQIDVLLSHSDGIHTYYTAVECKYWNEKVTKDIVMKVESITNDCNFDKSVIVSKIGFTPDAITYAKFVNVRLVELKENHSQIDDNEIIKFYMNFEISKPVLISPTLTIQPDQIKNIDSNFFTKNAYEYYFIKPKNEKVILRNIIQDFLNKKVLNNSEIEIISETINFEMGTYIKYPRIKKKYLVSSLTITGYNLKYTKLDDDYFENKVWMIMKLLFEEKKYTITYDGKIELPQPKESIKMNVGEKNSLKLKVISKKFKLLS